MRAMRVRLYFLLDLWWNNGRAELVYFFISFFVFTLFYLETVAGDYREVVKLCLLLFFPFVPFHLMVLLVRYSFLSCIISPSALLRKMWLLEHVPNRY